MATQNDAQNSDGTQPSDNPFDESDPTGRYHSSAAERVQQTVAGQDDPPPAEATDAVADVEAEPEAPLSPSDRYPWMKDTRQWGVRAPLSSRGLTIEAINIGIYGDIPDESREMTRMPRGSFAIPGMPRLDNYSVNRKEELWSDNTPALSSRPLPARTTRLPPKILMRWPMLRPNPRRPNRPATVIRG